MPEFCRIHYDHYYDDLGSQFVLVVVYEDGSAIDEIWSNSGSLDDEEVVKRFGDQKLAQLLDKMRAEGWELVSTEDLRSTNTSPISHSIIHQMKR